MASQDTPRSTSETPIANRSSNDRASRNRARAVRTGVLAAVLLAITAFGFAHMRGASVVGVDALCPFGGIETLWSLIAGAGLVQRIAASSVILLAGVVVVALVFRRSFCGLICPLGALQEFAAKLGGLFFKHGRPKMPAALDRPARYIKYLVLAVFTVWTWQAASLVIRPYDPWVAWMHLTSPEVLTEFAVGLAVLGISVVGSVVYDRFFCKYACPMGAFLGLVSRVSVFKVRRDANVCTSCGACDKVCPVNVDVSTATVVEDPECIDCNECVNVCPAAGALTIQSAPALGAKRVSPLVALAAVSGILIAIIGATTISGAFAWTMPSLAEISEQSGGAPFNVENIKGSMTFMQIAQATGISGEVFRERFKVKESEMATPIKQLAESHGFNVEADVRPFVAEKLGSGAK